ncbi:MAG: putative Ig domain-containing protein, partial [Planctomycetota bacterium]
MKTSLSLLMAVCALVALILPATVVIGDPPTSTEQDLPVTKRARYATHYDLGNGRTRAVVSIHAQNYQDADGAWHPIREEIDAADPTSGYQYQCLENGLISRFGTRNALPFVSAHAHGAPEVTMTPVEMVCRDSNGAIVRRTSAAASTVEQTDIKTLQYSGIFPGAIDEYMVMDDQVKHTLILDANAIANLPGNTSWIGGTWEMVLPAGYTVRTSTGDQLETGTPVVTDETMNVFGPDGTSLYNIQRVTLTDSNPAAFSERGRFVVELLAGNRLHVTMEAPASWALDPARVLPLRIDPTFAVQPDPAAGKDTWIYQSSPASNYQTDSSSWIGYVNGANAQINALLAFDLTSIPTFAQVTDVRYEWYHFNVSNLNGMSIDCFEITQSWVESGPTWNSPVTFDATRFDNMVPDASALPQWRLFNTGFDAMCQAWISGAKANNGFRMHSPTAGVNYGGAASSDHPTVANRPKIAIDYDLGPQIQTPAAGALPDGYIGTGYNQTYTITGGQAPISWSIIAGSLPTGLNIDTGTGAITGNPSAVGNFSFTVEVKDNNNLTDTQAQTIQIYNALAITNPPAGALADGIENIAYTTVTVTATGGKPTLVWSIPAGSLPTGLSLNTANGQITGTPTVANVYNFTVRVTDANAVFVERAYTITVYDLPTITSPAPGALLPEGYVGAAFSRQINAAGGVFPYTWDISAGALPPGLTINSVSGLISGNPTTTGNYSFSVRVTDSNTPTPDNDVEAYTLQILALPTISSPAAGPLPNATRNAPNYTQTFTGANGKTPYSWNATGLPAGMTLNSISGVLNGTPTASGVFNITVTLNDANLKSDAKNYQLTVNAAVQITTTSLPDGEEDALYSQTPAVTGGTAPITWTLGISPSLPELTIDANTGEISGTPPLGAQGTYQLSITATDSMGGTHNRNISSFITQPGGGTAAN